MANSKDEKRDAILAAAFEAFKTFGLRKVTLEDIAAKVGMATSSLYYYFDSKKSLFRAVVEQEIETIFRAKQAAVGRAGTAEEKLFALWTTMAERLERYQALSPTEMKNLQDAIWEAREFVATWHTEHERLAREILDAGAEEGAFAVEDRGQIAFIITMIMRGLVNELISVGRIGELREVAEASTRLILEGLKKR